MKKFLVLVFTCFISISSLGKMKVMTFNTMCDLCKGSKLIEYAGRLSAINRVIQNHQPQLMGLQELRTKTQALEILRQNQNLKLISHKGWFMSYADPVIAYDFKTLKELETGQLWLGPNATEINFGWKWALPRQIVWAKLEHIKTKNKFIFITGHFDNRIENLTGASKLVHDFIAKQNFPVIFAGDTNLTPDMDLYQNLLGDKLINAFDQAPIKEAKFAKSEKELCYTKKGSKFPACRVDHFLLSKNYNWNVLKYALDLSKNHKGGFPSDHRPVILDVDFP